MIIIWTNFFHSSSLNLLLCSHLSGRSALTAVWPQVTGNWDNIGGNGGPPWIQLCVCVFVTTRYALAHARLAQSAWSGFNWMISTLLACAVSVVQTLSRSHRLQQAPPLSIKANPSVTCEMTTGQWLSSHGVTGGHRQIKMLQTAQSVKYNLNLTGERLLSGHRNFDLKQVGVLY